MEKILFICNANIGRSQMAESIFNNVAKSHFSISAGTDVNYEGAKIHSLNIDCMAEIGLDLSKNKRTQLTEEISKQSSKIIAMCEKNSLPNYLIKKKIIFWKVSDPKNKSLMFRRNIRDQIKKLVNGLVKDLENIKQVKGGNKSNGNK
jgi:protein-tyrosine-phosphatase|tara:strand:+ start:1197 stop:1640 length:444 start_codon:yes stop_codon:yes gene_type:complete